MQEPTGPIYIGDTQQKLAEKQVEGGTVAMLGEPYYQIRNFDALEPFFMSIVSGSDHWLFISSTGGLSAGRGSAENALFPYYTDDKITENSENTGSKALLLVTRSGRTSLWEPFSERQRGLYAVERNLFKNVSGTALVFEETNRDLGLTYRCAWRTSDQFGFVRSAWLVNAGPTACRVELLDGLQNLLPANVASESQKTFSSLLDAYKRSELVSAAGLAVFGLNSRLTDLAEPSESLLATTVLQLGLAAEGYLLSSAQLDAFRSGRPLAPETEVRGKRGAYFVHTALALDPGQTCAWHILADVQQDSAAVVQKSAWLCGQPAALAAEVEADIAASQERMARIVAGADGLQISESQLNAGHHFANVMFNLMRGGSFADQYWVRAADFADYVAVRNRPVLQAQADFFAALPPALLSADLRARAEAAGSPDLLRLAATYLPLSFSRRHGDPSRPWNRFAINIKKPDGSLKLDYEGNWRDIFQNWEALAYSYPEFIENMIGTFLNATTADGYNPYRITYRGVDWEVPEPGNPWANIGYWGDHQIIYLEKLMEISARLHPGSLPALLSRPIFSYAHVPYRIKPYADLLKDPYQTIDFNWDLEHEIAGRQKQFGTDGKLVFLAGGTILQVSLAEKLLTLLLGKLANFVPEGGIWMNTQRPEWNDANNALVGKGLSVVTLGYLRRYLAACRDVFSQGPADGLPLSVEVQHFYSQVAQILRRFEPVLQGAFTDEQRRSMLDELGQAGSDYRWAFYAQGFSGASVQLPAAEIVAFLDLAQRFVEHSLRANRRGDNLYHSYNILHLRRGRASISRLYEMLEGQVSILSSGTLDGAESLALLKSLRASRLYQASQHSYILYPDRDLPGFLEKNTLSPDQVKEVTLFARLAEAQDLSVVTRDRDGAYHFSGHLRNAHDLNRALQALQAQPQFAPLAAAEEEKIKALFEDTFHHNEFTGRSGTFFAYEGLGSVYWHMVAKLLLAAQETALRFQQDPAARALLDCYADIRLGMGFNKSPREFGAFPTDPYSHTPKGQGAKQPGMTGLVKEEILTRQAELCLTIADGKLVFDTWLLDSREFLTAPAVFAYLDVHGHMQQLELRAGSLAYCVCQTPVVLEKSGERSVSVFFADGTRARAAGTELDEITSRHIFQRDGAVHHLVVAV